MSLHRITIKPILKAEVSKKTGDQQIVIEYRVKGGYPARHRFPTQLRSKKSDWNKRLGISLTNQTQNDAIREEVKKLEGARDVLIQTGKEPDIPSLLAYLNQQEKETKRRRREVEDKEALMNRPFLEWMDMYCYDPKVKFNTIRVRKIVRNHVSGFNKDVTLREMNLEWFEDFKEYLIENINKGQDWKSTTVHAYLKRLGEVFGHVEKHCIRYPEILAAVHVLRKELEYIQVTCRYDEPIGLDYAMFMQLLNFNNFPADKMHLKRVRDHFVLGVSIGGLRIEDYYDLKNDKIRKEQFMVNGEIKEFYLIDYYEAKSEKYHHDIVVLPYANKILDENEGHIPFRPVRAVFNRQLKELAKLLEWTHEVDIKEYDLEGRLKKEWKEKFCDIFSSKMMRKTRVAIDEYAQIEEKVSRMATGHQSKARERYNVKNIATMLIGNEKHFNLYEQCKTEKVG